jgi:hypothetical protein
MDLLRAVDSPDRLQADRAVNGAHVDLLRSAHIPEPAHKHVALRAVPLDGDPKPGWAGLPPVQPAQPAVSEQKPRPARSHGVGGFYLAAVMGTLVSVDTSWRFFGDVLGITATRERALMFAVLEVTLIACGYSMRASVRRPDGTPGPARVVAWALCALSAGMAIVLSGPVVGVARVTLGPVLALVCLHLALGIEVRVRRGRHAGTWGRIVHELRERVLSRLGLADDARDALARTRDRALVRAARLTKARWAFFQETRRTRAVRISGATSDLLQRRRLVEQVASLQHIGDLSSIRWPNTWLLAGRELADELGIELAIEDGHGAATSPDTGAAIGPDTKAAISADTGADTDGQMAGHETATNADTQADTARPNGRTRVATETAKRVAKLVAKTPDIDAVTIADKLRISDRTARRHLADIKAATKPDSGTPNDDQGASS